MVGGVGGVSLTTGFLDGDEARQYPEILTWHSEVPNTGSRGGGGDHQDIGGPDGGELLEPGVPGVEPDAPTVTPESSKVVVTRTQEPLDWAA